MLLDDPQAKGGPSTVTGPQTSALGAFGSALSQGLADTSLGALGRWSDASGYKDDQVIPDEDSYYGTPFSRPGGFQKGMTVAMAKASAAKYDDEQAALKQAGHPVASVAGGIVGGLADPLYYIPYLDALAPALKAAEIAKRGEVLGNAAVQSINAMGATVLSQPLRYAAAASNGQDYDLRDAAISVAYAGLGGGFFGGLDGAMNLRYNQKVAGILKALDDVNAGKPIDTAGVVSPQAQRAVQWRESIGQGQVPDGVDAETMDPQSMRALGIAKTLDAERTPDETAFMDSYKKDGGVSYTQAKLDEELAKPAEYQEGLSDERRSDAAQRKAIEDMTPQEKDVEIERLRKAAATDELTGLPNKASFAADEAAGNLQASRVHMDLDNFKKVNDTKGHQAGDLFLQKAGPLLKDAFERVGGKVYRTGGDEFTGTAPSHALADKAMAEVRANLKATKITVELPDGSRQVMTDAGVSYGKGATRNEAEAALQADKRRAGKGEARFTGEAGSDAESLSADAAGRREIPVGGNPSTVAYLRAQLAALQHSTPDWSPIKPPGEPPPIPPSTRELSASEQKHLDDANEFADKNEGLARALKVAGGCYLGE